MSCHGFLNDENSTVILSCCIKLVDYYLSKGFLVIEKKSSAFNDVPLQVKQTVNKENLHENDSGIACYREIPSSDNTLKIITI